SAAVETEALRDWRNVGASFETPPSVAPQGEALFFVPLPFVCHPQLILILRSHRRWRLEGRTIGLQEVAGAAAPTPILSASWRRHLGPGKERQEEAHDLLRLLLLHPMAGAVDEVAAAHLGAGKLLHALDRPWRLVDPPIAAAGDEERRHVDGALGEDLEVGVG